MPDLHLRVLRQIARARRRQLQSARAEPSAAGGDRVREATKARARADAQLAAASARRRLDAPDDGSEEQR